MPNRSMSQDWELSHPLAGVASVWSRRTYTIERHPPALFPGVAPTGLVRSRPGKQRRAPNDSEPDWR